DLRGETGVIRQSTPARARQLLGDLLGAPARQAVDDARLARVLVAEKAGQLCQGIGLGRYPVADVRAIEAADEGPSTLEAEPVGDFASGRRIRGRGERNARHRRPALVQGG